MLSSNTYQKYFTDEKKEKDDRQGKPTCNDEFLFSQVV